VDPALFELIDEGSPDDEVAVVLRLSDPTAAPPDVRLVAQFGNIATCRLRRGDILAVRAAAPVRSMKAREYFAPAWLDEEDARGDAGDAPDPAEAIDVWIDDSEALPADERDSDQRRPDIPGLPTGRGVVVAHIDWGLDIVHPAFRHPDGTTRVLALWDQRGPAFPDRPNRYGYGRIFDREDINRALRSSDPYAALGYEPADFDTSRGTHGAHTTSISAGSAAAAGPSGIAPESDIIFCHLSTYTAEGPTNLGDSVAYVEAIDFIVRTATAAYNHDTPSREAGEDAESVEQGEAGREERGPLRGIVVNSSLGRHGGPHVGLTLVEQGLDAALRGTVGLAFVHSAGNYYNRHIHSRGTLRPGEAHTVRLHVPAGGRRDEAHTFTTTHVELWYPGTDRIAVVVTAPDGTRFPAARGDEQHDLLLPGGEGQPPREIGRLYHRLGDPNTGDNEAALFLDSGAPAGVYEFTVLGEDIADGRYHFWAERNPAGRRAQATFDPRDSDPETTTGTICNGFRTIAVGAYDRHAWQEAGTVPDSGRPLAPFSSSGPTRDGRQKPDLCAPGVQVLAARSRPRRWPGQEEGRPPPLVSRMSGTSMAAPHVTGTIALMFEAATVPLAIEDVRRLLLANTDPLPDDAPLQSRRRVGSGFLNIPAAVDAARAYQPATASTGYVARLALQPPLPETFPEASRVNLEGLPVMSGIADSSAYPEEDIPESEPDQFTEADVYPPYDADEAFAASEGDEEDDAWEMGEAARSGRDERRASYRRRDSSLPISFVVPLGGGGIAPALTVPIGGAQSPFAFAVPLTSSPAPTPVAAAPVAGVPVMPVMPVMPDPAVPGGDAPIVVAEPLDPALLVAGTGDMYAFPAGGGEKEVVVGWFEVDEADPVVRQAQEFGERLVTAADALAAEPGLQTARSAALLTALLATATVEVDFGPEGAPSASTLFNAFVFQANGAAQRPRATQTLQRSFELVALPGQPLQPEELRPGDLLVRVARGEQWGHLSVVVTPHILRATEVGRDRPGGYVRVIEWAPVARRRDDRFARRVADEQGVLLPEVLVLRVREPQGAVASPSAPAQESESWSAWGESVVHTTDLTDAFFAAMHVVATSLGTQAEFLLAVMNSESGIRANAHNKNGNASGLIQFMPATLVRLGWTQGHEAFRRLSAEEQLPFVERYYRPFVRQGLNSTARLYQATFLPATLNRGSEPDTVIVDVNNNDNAFAYGPNRALDRRGDGRILVGDLTAFVERAKRSPRWGEALQRLNAAAPGPLPVPPPGPLPVPPVPVPPVPPGPLPTTRPLLRRGARGDAVREAQLLLNTVHMRNLAAGLPPLRGAPLEVDGAFGPRTFAAVVAFQQQAFPNAPGEWDGVIGPRTWARLEAAATGGPPGVPAPLLVPIPAPVNGGGGTEAYSPWERYAYWEEIAEQAPAINWCQIRQQIAATARGEEARWTRPNGTKFLENHPSRLPILQEYWSATPGFGNPATALDAARRSAADDPDFPWSAAFICFVMQRAGVQRQHGFEFSQRHMNFIVGALRNRERSDRNRPFWLLDHIELQNEVTLAPGDLLCFNRCRPQPGAPASADCPVNQVMTTHSYDSLRRQFWSGGNANRDVFGHSHTAIIVGTVVRNGQRFIETIGGNESNSVRLNATIPMNASGGIDNPGARRIFGAIKLIECT
jgi:subtilisin family serine protease